MDTQINRTSLMRIFTALLLLFFFSACGKRSESLINTAHLDHLYQEIELDGEKVGIIHIYAEYPDYAWTEAPGEGIACMDDITRAAVFYLRYARHSGREEYETRARYLLKSVLHLQAENGFFYNFISASHTIEKKLKNSLPRGDWWSWRALWALSESYSYYLHKDPDFAAILNESIQKTVKAIFSEKSTYPQQLRYEGLDLPTWLPHQYAADQAALIIIALAPYYKLNGNAKIRAIIEQMAEGILLMQVRDKDSPVSGAFLSWKNIWHAYGNSQAEALLLAGDILQEQKYSEAALYELNYFVRNMQKEDYYNYFAVRLEEDTLFIIEKQQFPQISYGIRPMVFAALRANGLTNEDTYGQQAGELACWLLGKNKAQTAVYDPQTGRCYDGIESEEKLNHNSGAESTIEALLTLLAIEQNPTARQVVNRYYQKRNRSK